MFSMPKNPSRITVDIASGFQNACICAAIASVPAQGWHLWQGQNWISKEAAFLVLSAAAAQTMRIGFLSATPWFKSSAIDAPRNLKTRGVATVTGLALSLAVTAFALKDSFNLFDNNTSPTNTAGNEKTLEEPIAPPKPVIFQPSGPTALARR